MKISLLLIMVGILGVSPAQAATLNIAGAGGILLGASGVDVGGVLYDVAFVDGTCIALFDGCDATSDFAFTDGASATAAAQALLDQVLFDGAQGLFDSFPLLTNGCSFDLFCFVGFPFSFQDPFVMLARAENYFSSIQDITSTVLSGPGGDSAPVVDFTWAVFTVVPEPGTGLLLAAGLVLLSVRKRAPATR